MRKIHSEFQMVVWYKRQKHGFSQAWGLMPKTSICEREAGGGRLNGNCRFKSLLRYGTFMKVAFSRPPFSHFDSNRWGYP